MGKYKIDAHRKKLYPAERRAQKKKWLLNILYGIGTIFFIVLLMAFLTGCDLEPIIDERCYDDYENFTFYEIEEEGVLGTMKSSYKFETPYGDIAIPDKVYEGAMEYDYAEICYERQDGIATTYLYTKKGNDLTPEPEIIIERVIETVIETIIETIYTYEVPASFGTTDPSGLVIAEDIGWLILPVTEENRLFETTELVNFQAGDIIILTIVFEPHTISADEAWDAQITQYRNGIIIKTFITEEVFMITTADSIEEYLTGFLDEYPEDVFEDLLALYNILYPEVE